MSNFAECLQAQLESKVKRNATEQRVLRILKGKRTPRRDRQVRRMERHALAQLRDDPKFAGQFGKSVDWSAVDWRAIDWQKWLDVIIQILKIILPLLI